jgi:DNA-binding response OmpR family regulator
VPADRIESAAPLRRRGIQAIEVATGPQALAAVRLHRFDLVVVSADLEEIDGLSLCYRLKREPVVRHVPVILLSDHAEPAARVKALVSGADEWFRKPLAGTGYVRRALALLRSRVIIRVLEDRLGRDRVPPDLVRFAVRGLGNPLPATMGREAAALARGRFELKRIAAVVEDLLDLGRDDRTRVALHHARVHAASCLAS